MNPQFLADAESRALAALHELVAAMEKEPPLPQASSRDEARARMLALHSGHRSSVDGTLRGWIRTPEWPASLSREERLLIFLRLRTVVDTVRQARQGAALFGSDGGHPPESGNEILELLAVQLWQSDAFSHDELCAAVDAQW